MRYIFVILIFQQFAIFGQNQSDEIRNVVNQDNDKYLEIFKDLHQNPELGFQETRTAGIIASNLKHYGYEVIENIGVTGLVGIMKNGEGPTVWYRADMDALPVKETADIEWASTKKAVMDEMGDTAETYVSHMCGHDAHVTWMLQIAKYFAKHKEKWKGTVVFIGQPAEEIGNGAVMMVEDGLYDKVPGPDFLFGMHTTPIAVGMVNVAVGNRMAGFDDFNIIFHGEGGHGSSPHKTKDPVYMAANAVVQYQSIVSRQIDPQNAAVLTVGSIKAGETNNVIPQDATVKINLRWFNQEDREILKEGVRGINEGIAHAYNLSKNKYPTTIVRSWAYPLVNDIILTKIIRKSLDQLVKGENLRTESTIRPVMASEDFQHLILEGPKKDVPYSYINIGVADPDRYANSMAEKGTVPYQNHNGDYEVDLKAIPFGSEVGINAMLAIFNE